MPYVALSDGAQVFALFGNSGDDDLLAELLPLYPDPKGQPGSKDLEEVISREDHSIGLKPSDNFFPLVVSIDRELGLSSIGLFGGIVDLRVEATSDPISNSKIVETRFPWLNQLGTVRGIGVGTFPIDANGSVYTLTTYDIVR